MLCGVYFSPWRKSSPLSMPRAPVGVPEIKGRMNIEQLNFEDRKIVEIARAMVGKPDILIIDETTTALAAKGRRLIYELIERMQKENRGPGCR